MKAQTTLTILIVITCLIALLGYGTYGMMKYQKENTQDKTQKIVERHPDLAKFFKV